MKKTVLPAPIKALIGLGNPGPRYYSNRHSIGFRIVDALVDQVGGSWRERDAMAYADIMLDGHKLIVIKPLTYMNASGRVMPYLTKQGIKAENILVIHDELELPFGKLAYKVGGSHKGHNGLKSLIAAIGPDFVRLRFGIGCPEDREMVPDYVLQNFQESASEIDALIDQAGDLVHEVIAHSYDSD